MIFLNRKRTITEKAPQKDPSKYWYIEKYVYGELKETVEVPLGTGTKFTGIRSGFLNDVFEGWSVSSTSITRKFNNTTLYKNTTTNVKNNLDSNNTLKIYAVYNYGKNSYKNLSDSVDVPTITMGNTSAESTVFKRFVAQNDCTISVSGYATITEQQVNNGNVTGSITTKYDSVTMQIYDMYGDIKNSVTLTKSGGTKNIDIEYGDRIEYELKGYYNIPTGQGVYGTKRTQAAQITITSTESFYYLNNYRVHL